MIPGIRKTMVKIQPTNLFTTVLIICYCNAGVLPPKIDQSSVSPPIPTPLRSGKCEYNGKYYEPGLITIDKDGDCVSDVTCMEGGVISIGDSSGCFGSMDKGTDDHYRLQASCAVWAVSGRNSSSFTYCKLKILHILLHCLFAWSIQNVARKVDVMFFETIVKWYFKTRKQHCLIIVLINIS